MYGGGGGCSNLIPFKCGQIECIHPVGLIEFPYFKFFFFFMLLVQKNDYPAHRITFTDIWTGLSAQHFEDGLQIQFLARIIKGTACAINSRSYKYHYIRPYRL